MSGTDAPTMESELLEGVRAILFDLDGTLIAVDKKAPEQLAQAMVPFKPLIPPEILHRLIRRVIRLAETPSNYVLAFGEKLGLNTDAIFAADRFRRLRGIGTSARSSLVPQAMGLLRLLRPHYRLAVVTSRSRRSARGFLERHELEPFFEVVVTRHDTWLQKPSSSPVKRAAQMLGMSLSACVMVGDTPLDMLSAKRAGVIAVGVLSGLGEEAELVQAGADLIVDHVGELAPMLLPSWQEKDSQSTSGG